MCLLSSVLLEGLKPWVRCVYGENSMSPGGAPSDVHGAAPNSAEEDIFKGMSIGLFPALLLHAVVAANFNVFSFLMVARFGGVASKVFGEFLRI